MKTSAKAALALGAASTLLLAACGEGGGSDTNVGGLEECDDNPNTCNSGERADGGEIVVSIPQAWDGWFINKSTSNSVYLRYPLSVIEPQTGGFLPDQTYEHDMEAMASEPELISEDPMKVRYEFNPDAVWSNGEPIGSIDDFLLEWYSSTTDEELCSPTIDCDPVATSWGDNVESIEENDGGIEVTYAEGYLDPEWMIGVPITYPGSVATEEGFDWKNDPEEMAKAIAWFDETVPTWSGGAYMIEEGSVEEGDAAKLTLVPNENWYGETKPTLDKIHINVIGNASSALTAFENGEVDVMFPRFEPAFAEQIGDAERAVSTIHDASVWEHIDFNTRSEFLDDVELRKAMMTAIDVQAIIDATFGPYVEDMEPRKNHVFSENSPYFEDAISESGTGSGDIDAAKKILEDAGYTGVGEKLMTPDGEEVKTFKMTHGASAELRGIALNVAKDNLEELGISSEVVPNAPDEFGTSLSNGEFDMTLFGWSGTPAFAGTSFAYWATEGGNNYGGYSDEAVDAAAEKALTTLDIDEAAKLENEAYKLAAEQYWVLPTLTQPNIVAWDKNLVNVRPNGSTQEISLYNVAEWGFKEGYEQ
ncbi:ABC transporter family substrate-binding protein [Salininema proteolyticum]|uniref:ABC transporter family substrate-binding protein n=1 Tax=Salininema proteolyticum TaxID=1607685 RepID=A0ABV8TV44_9ACTN